MANEKEVKQMEDLVSSMKSASDALAKVYPGASIAIKYMSEDIKIMAVDLKGRDAANEQARHSTRFMEGNQLPRSSEPIPGIERPFTSEEMTAAQAKIFGVDH